MNDLYFVGKLGSSEWESFTVEMFNWPDCPLSLEVCLVGYGPMVDTQLDG